MTLYIDVILLENIIMNYVIVLTTGMICKIDIKQLRMILSSILGSLYAMMSYLFNFAVFTNQISKMLLSIGMVYIAFGPKNIKNMLKQLIIFYLTSFCFGGAAYYLLYGINPHLIKSVNGILVGTYPIKIAILGGILGFFILNISFKIIKNKLTKKDMLYDVDIFFQEVKTSIKVILDTGNFLADPITNTPVLIVEAQKLDKILPKEILKNIENMTYSHLLESIGEELKTRCCIIPYSSIGKHNGMMIGIRPDYIKIYTPEGEEIKRKVMIGIYQNKIAKNGLYAGLMGLNVLNSETKVMV